MRYDRDAVSPWAFFLPIALAIVLGNLVSDAVGHALRARFEPAPVPVATPTAAPAPIGDSAPPDTVAAPATTMQPAPEPTPAAPIEPPHPDAASLATPENPVTASDAALPPMAVSGARRLSGPISARQAGESESCINGTVAMRSPNGWEQALENDAPVRCEASSN